VNTRCAMRSSRDRKASHAHSRPAAARLPQRRNPPCAAEVSKGPAENRPMHPPAFAGRDVTPELEDLQASSEML
jgi:hypothetical protein